MIGRRTVGVHVIDATQWVRNSPSHELLLLYPNAFVLLNRADAWFHSFKRNKAQISPALDNIMR
jgi:hypothetical protein